MKYLIITCLLMLPARTIYSQGTLIFSADTVIGTACDGFVLIGIIDVHNTSDQDVRIRWERQRLDFPDEGAEFMIAAGIQYLPGTPTHAFNLYGHDSTEIYFNLFLDTLAPGDSVIWQVLFYDEDDSTGTRTLLTAILECPQATAVNESIETGNVVLFPNPFSNTTTLQTGILPVDQIRIFDLAGRLLESRYLTSREAEIRQNGWVPGLYVIGLYHKGRNVGHVKMMVNN